MDTVRTPLIWSPLWNAGQARRACIEAPSMYSHSRLRDASGLRPCAPFTSPSPGLLPRGAVRRLPLPRRAPLVRGGH